MSRIPQKLEGHESRYAAKLRAQKEGTYVRPEGTVSERFMERMQRKKHDPLAFDPAQTFKSTGLGRDKNVRAFRSHKIG